MQHKLTFFSVLLALMLLLSSTGLACSQEGGMHVTAQTLQNYADNGRQYQYIALGSYPQAEDGAAQPILWRVLGVEDGYALLLSEYVLFNHRIHGDDKQYVLFEGEFRKTEIFAILNGSFLKKAFTPEEQELLLEDEELGRIFLASSADLCNPSYGFSSNRARQAFGTPYALANGLFRYRMTKTGRGSSPYWTRTRSQSMSSGVKCTKVEGRIGYIRCVVMNEGIRPAVRLPLQNGQIEVIGGDGTFDHPWALNLKK